MSLVHVQCYSLDPSVFVRRQQVNSKQALFIQRLNKKISRFTLKTTGNEMRLQKGYALRKYCFTTIYIIFIESEEMARRLGLRSGLWLIHLLCVCIGADSGDSADSTFSVTVDLPPL